MLQHLLGLVLPIIYVGLSVGLAWLLGTFLLGLGGWHFASTFEKHLFAVAVGLGGASYAALAVGLGGKLNTFTAAIVLLGAGVVGTLWHWFFRKTRQRHAKLQCLNRLNCFTLVLILFLAVLVLWNLAGSLAPPTDSDSMRHHLAAPKLYSQLGGFPFIPVFWWSYPGVQHVLHTLFLLLANDVSVQVFNWAQALLVTIAVYIVGRRFFSRQAGLLGAAIFYSLPMTTVVSTGSYVELLVSFCSLLSILALLNAGDRLNLLWILLAGILGGLAGATKAWGLLALPAAAVMLLVLQGRDVFSHWRRLLGAWLVYAVAFGLVLSPWMIRNYIAGGDPFWPHASSVFQNPYWQPWQIEKFSYWHLGPGKSLWQYLIGPWNLTNNIAAYSGQAGALSPLLLPPLILAFAPGTWLFRRRLSVEGRKAALGLALYALTVYTLWFGVYQQPRYIEAIHPLVALLAGVGIWLVWEEAEHRTRAVVASMVSVSLLAMLMVNFVFNRSALLLLFGQVSREEYLSRRVSYYEDLDWANRHLPRNAKVLFIGLQGFYYLDRPFVLGMPAYQGIIQYGQFSKPEEFLEELQTLGISHIYLELFAYNNAVDLHDAWQNRPPNHNAISYQEWRPIELMMPLLEAGNLKPVHRAKSSMITSRTFGTREDAVVAIYEVDYSSR
ncbi:glycosyltransferase family 39 protein [Acidobacteria bacterium AH-259-A15]|nr:glycosyltransferase family 39 protein [Acidobacteria bacterium AH-259-A15]